MKTFKYLLSCSIVILAFINCSDDEANFDYLKTVAPPTNVTAVFQVTQDNTGVVTITPNSDGATKYTVYFGDDTPEPVEVIQGRNIIHTYAEGTYTVKIVAIGITGLVSEITQELVVSFNAPENLDIIIENDAAISKQVNVTANADFAISYDVYFGEDGNDTPTTVNIGETVSYQYQEAGTYTIRIVVMGAAIETTEYIEEFEVTAIVQPLTAAPSQPFRQESDVVSIYSGAYVDIAGVDFYPNWGQSTTYTEIEIEGDNVIQYGNLNYQGIDFSSTPIDVSEMEFLHVDIWTADENDAKISPISSGPNETAFDLDLTAQQWTSFNIPVSFFTDQNPLVDFSEIIQFKFDGDPAGGTIFVDNLYFWKEPSSYAPLLFDDFEGNGNITTWSGDQAGMTEDAPNVVNESINTSLSVLKYEDTGGQYANVQFTADGKFNLTGGQSVFALKIYVPSSSITGSQPNQISLKLQNSDLGGNSWQTQTEIIKPITLDTWQWITFDFATDEFINLDGGSPDPVDRTDLDKVVIQVNSENNFDSVTAYIDDFSYGTMPPADTPPFATDDFEGNGTITTWLGDGAGADTAFANPIDGNVEGMNYSDTILLYEDTGGQYANVQFTVAPKFDLMAKNKFTLKLYVPSSSITGSQPNQIALKLQNSDLGGNSWQTQTEIIKPIILDAWQELTNIL
ncbi:MAG: hypothetical protein P8X62_09950 [Flavobacteriaceae bacterium]